MQLTLQINEFENVYNFAVFDIQLLLRNALQLSDQLFNVCNQNFLSIELREKRFEKKFDCRKALVIYIIGIG